MDKKDQVTIQAQYKYDTSTIQGRGKSAESAKQNFKSARVSECHDKN